MDEENIISDEYDILNEFAIFRDEIKDFHLPRWNELPDVELYMDQVVSLVDKYFKKLDYEDDKPILTPAMINNYVKQEVVPPPVKKRYAKPHLAYLIIITLLKTVLSINEISLLTSWKPEEIEEKYDNFCETQEKVFKDLDIEDAGDALVLSMMAVTTKFYAQRLIKIQVDTIRKTTAKLEEQKSAEEHKTPEVKHGEKRA